MPSSSRSGSSRRHAPLADDIVATGPLRSKSKKRKVRAEDETDTHVDSRSSRKILKIGQELADEEREENGAAAPNPAFAFESRLGEDSADEEDVRRHDEDAWRDEEGVVEDAV